MAAPVQATVTSDVPTSAWASSLPDDLIRLVASRVLAGDLLDYVRLRAVCVPWRSATASPRGRGVVDPRFHPRRWMMLPEGEGLHPGHPKLHGYVHFFNLDTGAFVRTRIPLFSDHCVLDSLDGLLVLQRDHDTAIRLLHPFTGDVLDLPPLLIVLPQMRREYNHHISWKRHLRMLRSVSAAATCAADGVVTVLLAFRRMFGFLAVATSQDRQWTVRTTLPYQIDCRPFLSARGKIYAVEVMIFQGGEVRILQIDTPPAGEELQPPKLITTCAGTKLCKPISFAECGSEILVIGGTAPFHPELAVYRLSDLVRGEYIPVTSLGGRAIFIQERALTVSSPKALPGVVGDTIVCTRPVERVLAQYHLSSGTWSPPMDQCSLRRIESGPCSLVHHIITCCSREQRTAVGLENLRCRMAFLY